MSILQKYPLDSRLYTFDFSRFEEIVNSGDSLTTVVSITANPATLTIGSSSVVTSGNVNVMLSGGTADVLYTVECAVNTASGSILTGLGYIQLLK